MDPDMTTAFGRRIAIHQHNRRRWDRHRLLGRFCGYRRHVELWSTVGWTAAVFLFAISAIHWESVWDGLPQSTCWQVFCLPAYFLVLLSIVLACNHAHGYAVKPWLASAYSSRHAPVPTFRVVIVGSLRSPQTLMVSGKNTVQDVLEQLRQRRTIPDLRRIQYNISHPSKQRHRKLEPHETLRDLGVGELSVLHIYILVMAESARPGPAPRSAWEGYLDGYEFPSEDGKPGERLCRCKRCHGGAKVDRRTYDRHHRDDNTPSNQQTGGRNSRPMRRAVPVSIPVGGSLSGNKESRPRSDSDEVFRDNFPRDDTSIPMDIDSAPSREDGFSPHQTPEPTPAPVNDQRSNAAPLPTNYSEIFADAEPAASLNPEQLTSIDNLNDESLDFNAFAGPAPEQDSDEEDEDGSESGGDADVPRRPAGSPSSQPSQPPKPASQPRTIFSPRPPWRSIPKEQVKINKLRTSLDFIELLESACATNSQLSAEDNIRLWNPPRNRADLSDPALRQGLKTFLDFIRDTKATLPSGAIDIGDGYQFRPRIDTTNREILNPDELDALKSYLTRLRQTPFIDGVHNTSITRCGKLYLPRTGQIVRSRWGEKEHNRVTRMVKFKSDLPEGFEIGEVQYFFRYRPEEGAEPLALAMVSVFGIPDRELLAESFGSMWVAQQGLGGMRLVLAKDILSVVAMIPFPSKSWGAPSAVQQKLAGKHYLYEKLGLGGADGLSE
ncbi:hypothetical protein MKEN_01307700 [Mycena kentingensis (nom. inval.)]|nr:hypothetical protein MKEN_01307700 [Mycena kentingensis (nom. inval.)]